MPRIFRTSKERDRKAGFTLFELAMAMVLVALIAALVFPRVIPTAGATAARASVYSIAALLRQDRNAALKGRTTIAATVDVKARTITSGSGGGSVQVADDFEVRLLTNDGNTIEFTRDGRSSGGVITLAREKLAYSVHVDPLTAGVTVFTGKP